MMKRVMEEMVGRSSTVVGRILVLGVCLREPIAGI
jgi:hypothetical protein